MPFNYNRPSDKINTNGMRMYSDGSVIMLDFWSQTISLKIAMAKGKGSEGETLYDYDNPIRMTLPADKSYMFGKMMKEKFLPALENGQECEFGVMTAKVNMLYISTGVKETGNVAPYIAIFNNIDPATKKPEKIGTYNFKKTRVMKLYEPDTGNFDSEEKYGEIYVVADFFEKGIFLYGVNGHAVRYVTASNEEDKLRFMDNAAARMNFNYREKHYVSRYSQKSDPFGSNNSSNTGNSFNDVNGSENIQSAASVDDLEGLMMETTVVKLNKKNYLTVKLL